MRNRAKVRLGTVMYKNFDEEEQNYSGLYQPPFERSNCGVGVLVDFHGRKSHQ